MNTTIEITTEITTEDSLTLRLSFPEVDVARLLIGQREDQLQPLEEATQVRASVRGSELLLSGSPSDVRFAQLVVAKLYALVARGYRVQSDDVKRAVQLLFDHPDTDLGEIFMDRVFLSAKNRAVHPKGLSQKHYIDAVRRHDLVFGVGPAGTGKTYLAVAMALAALQSKQVKRLILTRPAVEAGERLGFLPGDLNEKVNPYLRPLLDAMNDLMDAEQVQKMLEREVIEVAPLAFMRGRTLHDAFIILDEAQNTTREQMKMFLTRMGRGSRAVVTGDPTQVDLPRRQDSGLVEALRLLEGVEGIAIHRFSDADVVRHDLVQRIIRAYEGDADRREAAHGEPERAR